MTARQSELRRDSAHEHGRGRVEREETAVRRAAQHRGAAAVERPRTREHERGRHAAHPLQIPWLGWKDILWRTYREMQTDRLFSIAAGVAFFVLLAIFPAITALVSAYGLFFNATTITDNFSLLDDILPGNVLDLLREQAGRIAANGGGALGIGVIAGILVALWSTMSGVKAVIDALNVTYEEQESRSLIKLNLVALAITLAGFAAFLLVVGAVVVLPLVLSFVGLGGVTATLAWIVRWPALFVLLLVGLSVLYRYAPDRKRARWQWVSVGSVFADGGVDRRLVRVLLVPRPLRQLQRHLRLARRRGRPDDVAVDFGDRGAARRRAQRRDRAPDGARFDGRRGEAARRARRGDGRYRRSEAELMFAVRRLVAFRWSSAGPIERHRESELPAISAWRRSRRGRQARSCS